MMSTNFSFLISNTIVKSHFSLLKCDFEVFFTLSFALQVNYKPLIA